MQQIRNKCISMIQDKFPSTLAGCDDVLRRNIIYRPSEIDRLIPLARETNIPRVLPWAFYLCTQMGTDELLKNNVLSWKDKALCLAGKECLWDMRKTATHSFLLNFIPASNCTSSCKTRMPEPFPEALDAIETLRKTPHVLEEYTEWGGLRLCIRCQTFLQAQHRNGRERVWQSLPSFFQLGTWEDIFKEQSCWVLLYPLDNLLFLYVLAGVVGEMYVDAELIPFGNLLGLSSRETYIICCLLQIIN